MSALSRLSRRVARLKARLADTHLANTLPSYRDRPLDYISDVLGLTLTSGQVSVVEALMLPPRRVLVASGHSVGKTILAAALVNWWFDTRDPGICLTTAPTDRQVKDLLWKEVRLLREKARLPHAWVGPKFPRLETNPAHFAHGFTASEATRFQGHHSPGGVFVLFDEAEGVDARFWQAAKTMLDDNSYWLCTYNPTTPGSAAHIAEQEAEASGTFRRVNLSCLDHPNLTDDGPYIPGAITPSQAEAMLLEDSEVLPDAAPILPGDVELRGRRFRPGPVAEARVLGRRPANSTTGVWSEALWSRVLATRVEARPEWPVALGCDVARYGDDQTTIWVRKGLKLLHAEVHVKQSTTFTAARLRELCDAFKDDHNSPRRIPCMIDEGGIGGGVIDQHDGHLFVPVNASCKPRHDARYHNVRSELWFVAREPALSGLLDVSAIPPHILTRLKSELMVATYKVLPTNSKVAVASKDDMKALLKRSPDLADGFNLCLYPPTAQA